MTPKEKESDIMPECKGQDAPRPAPEPNDLLAECIDALVNLATGIFVGMVAPPPKEEAEGDPTCGMRHRIRKTAREAAARRAKRRFDKRK